MGARNLTIFPCLVADGPRLSHDADAGAARGFKMAEVSGANPSASPSAWPSPSRSGLFAYWSAIHLTYQHGDSPLVGHNMGQWQQLAAWITYRRTQAGSACPSSVWAASSPPR